MTDANESRFGVTASDLERYDWQPVISRCRERQCETYHYDLFKRASELQTAGDSLGQKVFAFVATICSFHANYDSPGNPFQPVLRSGDQRALMAEDLVEADLDVLRSILPSLDDCELRARVADILWECARDHKAARIAIAAYIDSASRLEGGEFWSPSVDRLERALQLAAKIEYGKKVFKDTASVIEGVLKTALVNSRFELKAARLMEVLLSFRVGDAAYYAQEAEKVAVQLEKSAQWNFAEEYWSVGARSYRRAKREGDALRCEIRAAETMVNRAEANLVGPTPSYMFAAHWLSRGFETFGERTAAVHVRLLEV